MKVTNGLLFFLVYTALLLFSACGTARRSELVTGPRDAAASEVSAGRLTFDRYCNQCHPGGTAGLGPAINNKPLPGWMIKFQVRHGLGKMPSFSDDVISDEELDDLVRYLKWLRRLSVNEEAVESR